MGTPKTAWQTTRAGGNGGRPSLDGGRPCDSGGDGGRLTLAGGDGGRPWTADATDAGQKNGPGTCPRTASEQGGRRKTLRGGDPAELTLTDRTTLPLAKRAWRTLARTTRRTTRTGEDVVATVTHHSDVPVTLPNIATSVRLVQHGEGEEAEHKIRSSGGCGWVPRYEDGATHDHFMGGARRGTVTHPKP